MIKSDQILFINTTLFKKKKRHFVYHYEWIMFLKVFFLECNYIAPLLLQLKIKSKKKWGYTSLHWNLLWWLVKWMGCLAVFLGKTANWHHYAICAGQAGLGLPQKRPVGINGVYKNHILIYSILKCPWFTLRRDSQGGKFITCINA